MKTARELKKELKEAGIETKGISIRCEGSIHCKVKDLSVEIEKVQEIVGACEKIGRCEMAGEILSGGNTFVFTSYDWEEMARFQEAIKPAVLESLEGLSGVWKVTSIVDTVSKNMIGEQAVSAIRSAVYGIVASRTGQYNESLRIER